MALCPEHPKRDQNPNFTPLSETTSIPVGFIWESPPPPGESYRHSDKRKCFSLVVIAPVLGKISGPTLNEAEYDTKN